MYYITTNINSQEVIVTTNKWHNAILFKRLLNKKLSSHTQLEFHIKWTRNSKFSRQRTDYVKNLKDLLAREVYLTYDLYGPLFSKLKQISICPKHSNDEHSYKVKQLKCKLSNRDINKLMEEF